MVWPTNGRSTVGEFGPWLLVQANYNTQFNTKESHTRRKQEILETFSPFIIQAKFISWTLKPSLAWVSIRRLCWLLDVCSWRVMPLTCALTYLNDCLCWCGFWDVTVFLFCCSPLFWALLRFQISNLSRDFVVRCVVIGCIESKSSCAPHAPDCYNYIW